MQTSRALIALAEHLVERLRRLSFGPPVTHVYNPLEYAWGPHREYLERFGRGRKRVLFLGMNPGPFGMVQTGVPFGEVAAARDWMGIRAAVLQPKLQHGKRPIQGFACPRSEVSGRRLWGFFAAQFGSPGNFFKEHLVMNYCPLAFLEESGKNRTPDKLAPEEREALHAACDEHLLGVVKAVQPEWVVGVGGFARDRATLVCGENGPARITTILHPSPASPAANRDWAGSVLKQLHAAGVWHGPEEGR